MGHGDPPGRPLARYWVRQGATRESLGTETTDYEIFGRSHLRAIEIIRTYVYFWLLVPAALFGPIGAGIALDDDPSGDNAELVGGLVSVVLLLLVLGLLYVHGKYWRPVREARWVTGPARDDSAQQ